MATSTERPSLSGGTAERSSDHNQVLPNVASINLSSRTSLDIGPKLTRTASARDEFRPDKGPHTSHTNLSVIVLGASGDLAKKKTYPALFALFTKR